MPICKAYEVAYIRFSAPDLDKMQEFVEAFGLRVAHRSADALYSRGIAAAPFVHVVHRGPPKFLGFAFQVRSDEDLRNLAARVPGCSRPRDIGGVEGELGGGRRVHFADPNGFVIEAVHGQSAAPLAPKVRRLAYNHGGVYEREGVHPATGANLLQDVGNRTEHGSRGPIPTEVRRLAHVVIATPRLQETLSFLTDTFGLLPSDTLAPDADPKRAFGQFLHMDRGEEYTDHHSVFVLQAGPDKRTLLGTGVAQAQLSHASFEVQSIDGVFLGHEALRRLEKRKLATHAWGVGRHVFGGQVYDYWHDPYGHVHEHMCDSDRVNAHHPHTIHDPAGGRGDMWGPTVRGSNPGGLNGPQGCPGYSSLSQEEQESLVSRKLPGVLNAIVARL